MSEVQLPALHERYQEIGTDYKAVKFAMPLTIVHVTLPWGAATESRHGLKWRPG